MKTARIRITALFLVLLTVYLLVGCARWQENYAKEHEAQETNPFELLMQAYKKTKKAVSLRFESLLTHDITGQRTAFLQTKCEGSFSRDEEDSLTALVSKTVQEDGKIASESQIYYRANRMYTYKDGSATYKESLFGYSMESACLKPLMLDTLGAATFRTLASEFVALEPAIETKSGATVLSLTGTFDDMASLLAGVDELVKEVADDEMSCTFTVNKAGYLSELLFTFGYQQEDITYHHEFSFTMTPSKEEAVIDEPDWTADAAEEEGEDEPLPELILSEEKVKLYIGEELNLKKLFTHSGADSVLLENTNPIIGEINQYGTFLALLDGRTTVKITARSGNRSVTKVLKITVLEPPPAPVAPSYEFTLNTNAAVLNMGQSFQIEANVKTEHPVQILYVSNNERIAAVDENGLITTVDTGNTVISVILVIDGEEIRAGTVNVTVRTKYGQ